MPRDSALIPSSNPNDITAHDVGGTSAYWAPEIHNFKETGRAALLNDESKPLGSRRDIWAVGSVIALVQKEEEFRVNLTSYLRIVAFICLTCANRWPFEGNPNDTGKLKKLYDYNASNGYLKKDWLKPPYRKTALSDNGIYHIWRRGIFHSLTYASLTRNGFSKADV